MLVTKCNICLNKAKMCLCKLTEFCVVVIKCWTCVLETSINPIMSIYSQDHRCECMSNSTVTTTFTTWLPLICALRLRVILQITLKMSVPIKYCMRLGIFDSTDRLTPVRYLVVVVLQDPTAILRQPLDRLQPQSAGEFFAAANRPRSSTTTTTAATAAVAAVPQRTHPTQLQHRRHEDIFQPAVPRHAENAHRPYKNLTVQRKIKVVIK